MMLLLSLANAVALTIMLAIYLLYPYWQAAMDSTRKPELPRANAKDTKRIGFEDFPSRHFCGLRFHYSSVWLCVLWVRSRPSRFPLSRLPLFPLVGRDSRRAVFAVSAFPLFPLKSCAGSLNG